MSNRMESAMNALAGQTDSAEGGASDWETKYKELERKFHTEQVEAGRLRQANDELAAARRRIAELEGASRTQMALAEIPEEIGGDIPSDFKATSAVIAQHMVDQSMAGVKDRLAKMEQSAFYDRVNTSFPGFLAGIEPGGDKNAAWNTYLKHNSASVKEALKAGDYDALSYHINAFYSNHLGVPTPSGREGSAIPDPSASVGGVGGAIELSPTRVYTYSEIDALYDRIEECRNREDFATANRIGAEIKRAIAEGRVK